MLRKLPKVSAAHTQRRSALRQELQEFAASIGIDLKVHNSDLSLCVVLCNAMHCYDLSIYLYLSLYTLSLLFASVQTLQLPVLKSAAYTARHKQALGSPFTSLGVVVPHTLSRPSARTSSVELGYRPIPYSTTELQQLFETIRKAVDSKSKVDYSECMIALGRMGDGISFHTKCRICIDMNE